MKTKILLLGLFLVIGLVATGCATDNKTDNDDTLENTNDDDAFNVAKGPYTLDVEDSTIAWSATKIAATPHTGTINLKSGSIDLTDINFATGSFVIDMTTITSDQNLDNLIKHLNSADFFNVKMYPTSTLNVKSISKLDDSKYNIVADLTILNVTKEITFPATLIMDDDNLIANAKFDIDRTKWGIKYNSGSFFKDLGDNTIKDEISYTLNLKFNPN
ncbi:MAG: YceI family protein [Candidatus Woesearchaeota archaeon]|jgi:polyisoprenoid-binding protein YceI